MFWVFAFTFNRYLSWTPRELCLLQVRDRQNIFEYHHCSRQELGYKRKLHLLPFLISKSWYFSFPSHFEMVVYHANKYILFSHMSIRKDNALKDEIPPSILLGSFASSIVALMSMFVQDRFWWPNLQIKMLLLTPFKKPDERSWSFLCSVLIGRKETSGTRLWVNIQNCKSIS